jgi:hypothetical protein
MPRSTIHIFLLISIVVLLMPCMGCKKSSPIEIEKPAIDSDLIGAWYNAKDTVGFEVFSDGSTKTLTVDSLGKLQYMPAKDTVKRGTIILTILKTDGEEIQLRIVYRIPKFIDTTVTVVGQYSFSSKKDTLSLTVPDPSSGKPTTVIYRKASIGELVIPRYDIENLVGVIGSNKNPVPDLSETGLVTRFRGNMFTL